MIRDLYGRARRKLTGKPASPDRARYRRRLATRLDDYPPPYPNGWYRIASSVDIARGQSIRVDCLGSSLVAFRSSDSDAIFVLDAHCPHQGADLGVGGKVVRNCIRCPFHHFQFDGAGNLVDVPSLEHAPKVRTKSWPVREVHGMVWIYHDAQRRAPPYEPVIHQRILDGDMVLRGEHDAGVVNMHLIEFAENSVDFQHFVPLHGNMLVPWTQIPIPGVDVHHEPNWRIDEERQYVAYFENHATLRVLGKLIPRTSADAQITFFGPGGVVYFLIRVPDAGDILIYQTHLPLEPMALDVQFRWFADKKMPRALVSYVVGSWVSQWRADIEVWENKVYKDRPKLVRSDGPVLEMRRWYRQFYEAPANLKVAS